MSRSLQGACTAGLIGLVLLFALAYSQGPEFDVLLVGGRVVDGTGAPWFYADVAIRGDSIAAVGSLASRTAKHRLDVQNLVVAPGFIDIHSHADRALFRNPLAENYIRQGVTTVIGGNDGFSPLPLGRFLDRVEDYGIAVNIGMFVGHGSIRQKVMGLQARPPTPQELEQMKALVKEAMLDGAFGLSTGLFYLPGYFASTDEVISLARVAAQYGGMHISHMRDETKNVLQSVEETILIGEQGGLPTQVTHHKIIGQPNWGLSRKTYDAIVRAREQGIDVTVDQYPYTASSAGLQVLFPQWAYEGGTPALILRLRDGNKRQKIKEEIVRRLKEERGGGELSRVQLADCAVDSYLNGKTIAQVLQERHRPLTLEEAAELLIELEVRGGCTAIYHAISEEDVERIIQWPFTMICSDGTIPVFGEGKPHPRSYGAFARVFARYVREKKLMPLEEAVRKMTSMPAARLKLMDRGLIRPGMKADLVVFDPQKIADTATFEKPHQYAVGVYHVFVNGKAVLLDGKMTVERPGKALRGPGYQPRP